MKVFVQHRPENRPWGGGNQFVLFIIDYLKKNNHEITFNLESDVDVFFIINPKSGPMRKNSIDDVFNFRNSKCKNGKIYLRVNENDSRKNTNHMDNLILNGIKKSDYVIYISNWLKEYFIQKKAEHKNNPVVFGMACDEKIFYPAENKVLSSENNQKIKIITHHHSENWMKGFDIYQEIDNWLHTDNEASEKYEFYYMGNLNRNFKKKSTIHIPEKHIKESANFLRDCDIYITATINEPGGNHHVEGVRCGLPILYDNKGGAVVEYGERWGLGFNNFSEFKEKLDILVKNYYSYREKIDYNYLSSERCCKEYLDFFLKN